jgi:hypothetical protein
VALAKRFAIRSGSGGRSRLRERNFFARAYVSVERGPPPDPIFSHPRPWRPDFPVPVPTRSGPVVAGARTLARACVRGQEGHSPGYVVPSNKSPSFT